jgi:hypothetical protein
MNIWQTVRDGQLRSSMLSQNDNTVQGLDFVELKTNVCYATFDRNNHWVKNVMGANPAMLCNFFNTAFW